MVLAHFDINLNDFARLSTTKMVGWLARMNHNRGWDLERAEI